ncbi:hypothetical protein K466DRAFT_586467 [Polyporus arcularius HHB13444]|uniref:F-box domain-containing protein n=1 Tax=Polyporus arcularius HHB13444 TaxID=1314778 RepID=A0A5C3PC73_9APHY|nr:hypothetical protein K466DRAFT_586467 [Polyporus arcularius HHB13444]
MSFLDITQSVDSLHHTVEESIRLEVMRPSDDDLTDIEDRLRTTIAHLRRYRNSITAPVNRLPWEILGRIFEFAVQRRKYISDYGNVREVTKATERLTWVCHAWRTVASGWPRLWSTIHESQDYPLDSARSRLALSRSGEVPLVLHLQLPLCSQERTVFQDICDNRPYQVREAYVTLPRCPVRYAEKYQHKLSITSFLSSTFPNLDYLHLVVSLGVPYPSSTLFGGQSSQLRALTLNLQRISDITVANTFSNLIHLRIIYALSDMEPLLQETSPMNNLLRNSPCLETLVISAYPQGFWEPQRHHQGSLVPISLPDLRAICLYFMPIDAALVVLSRIQPSSSTKINLTKVEFPRARGNTPWHLTRPKPITALRSVAGLTDLDVVVNVHDGKWESFYINARGPDSGVSFEFDNAVDGHRGHIQRLFCQEVDTRGITTLRISTSGSHKGIEERFLRFSDAFMANMPSVSKLVLRLPGSPGNTWGPALDVDSMMDYMESILAPDLSDIPVPQLEFLSIEVPIRHNFEHEKLVEGMARISRARERVGHPIRSVTACQSSERLPAIRFAVTPPPSEDGCTVAVAGNSDGPWQPSLGDMMANSSTWAVIHEYWGHIFY